MTTTVKRDKLARRVARVALAGAATVLAGCGGGATGNGSATGGAPRATASASPSQTAVAPPSVDPAIAQLAALPDIPIGSGESLPSIPAIQGNVRYKVSLLRPFFTVIVPGAGWGAQQYANKPFFSADFVLHPELGENPDGFISFVAGLGVTQPTSPSEYVDEERTLDHQQLGPVMAGTLGGLTTVEYEAAASGGDVVSTPEFSISAGWRLHLVACDVDGHTFALVYAAPQAKFAAFATTAQSVLASVEFVR